MQGYTHCVIGAVLGSILFPDNYPAIAACAAVHVTPDAPLVPQLISESARGKQALTEQSPGLLLVKEIFYAFPIWLPLGFSAFLAWLWFPELFGQWGLQINVFFFLWIAHVMIDRLTHKGEEYVDTDPTFTWPFKFRLNIGLWEHRYGPGIWIPKPLEVAVNLLGLLILLRGHLDWLLDFWRLLIIGGAVFVACGATFLLFVSNGRFWSWLIKQRKFAGLPEPKP